MVLLCTCATASNLSEQLKRRRRGIEFIGTVGNCQPFFSLPSTWRFLRRVPYKTSGEKYELHAFDNRVTITQTTDVFAFKRPTTNTVVVNKGKGVRKTVFLVKKNRAVNFSRRCMFRPSGLRKK